MTKKEKQNIITAWNEIEEAQQSFKHLIELLNGVAEEAFMKALNDRLNKALDILGNYFTNDEAQHFLDY